MKKVIDSLVTYGIQNFEIARWGLEYGLFAARPIRAGEVVVTERPLVAAHDRPTMHPTFAWDLVDLILANARLTEQFYSLQLHATKFRVDMDDQRTERELSKKYKRGREVIRKLYMSVCTNNVGYGGSIGQTAGHGIYPVVSRANHSCVPSAEYNSTDVATKEVSLVALADIEPGKAITWNYGDTPEFNAADYVKRNFNLVDNFRFVCRCPKCELEMPTELTGVKDLVGHFDGLIKDFINSHVQEMLEEDPESIDIAGLQNLAKTTRFSLA